MDNSSDDDDYVLCEGCYESETNKNATLRNNNLEDGYTRMNRSNGYIDHSSIKNSPQRLFKAILTRKGKSANNLVNENDINCQEIVKKRKNHAKQNEYQLQVTMPTEKLQFSISQKGLTKILSSEPVIETQPQKEPLFRTRSNACFAQNKKMYLKKLNSANI